MCVYCLRLRVGAVIEPDYRRTKRTVFAVGNDERLTLRVYRNSSHTLAQLLLARSGKRLPRRRGKTAPQYRYILECIKLDGITARFENIVDVDGGKRIAVCIEHRDLLRGRSDINADKILFLYIHNTQALCFSSHAARSAEIISSTIAAGSAALNIPLVLPVASAPSIIVL